jgi:hypothetical protein
MPDDTLYFLEEIASTVGEAAGGQKVLVIRLAVGRGLSLSRERIASGLSKRFPSATVEIADSKAEGAVVVKDIEVE